MDRRKFLRGTSLATVGGFAVRGFSSPLFAPLLASGVQEDRVLVLIQLYGGNDGLNTVVPFGDDAYHRLRPKIGVKGNALKLDDHFTLNPALGVLKNVFDQGHLAIVNGCGLRTPMPAATRGGTEITVGSPR